MSNQIKPVKFVLSGGIGNQLFQYSAAKYFESRHDLNLIFEEFNNKQIKSNYTGPVAMLFNDETLKVNKLSKYKLMIMFMRLDWKFIKSIRFYKKARRTYVASEIGFIQPEPNFSIHKIISGYFQSYLYANFTRDLINRRFRELALTPWTKDKIIQAKTLGPIAVHVRRGDYTSQAERYGLLGEDYYLGALSKIIQITGTRVVWIFSDGSDQALESMISNKYQTTVIKKPADTTDLEVMLLMSKCSAHIIANSTFSWWAAFLSESTLQICAPKPWTISGINPNALIPPKWLTVDSGWLP